MQALNEVGGVVKVSTAGTEGNWIAVDMTEPTNGEAADRHINNRLLDALIRADVTVLQFRPRAVASRKRSFISPKEVSDEHGPASL